MSAEAALGALLHDLYAGVTQPERMHGFLARLSAASGSHLSVLVRQDAAVPGRTRLYNSGLDASLMARYENDDSSPPDKLWFERTREVTRTGSVLNGDDWVGTRELKRTRYYADVLRHADTVHSVALCGALTATRQAFITPCRSERAGPYGPAEMRLFEQVAPHWVNACTLMSRFEWLDADAPMGSAGRGMFLLDRSLRWIGGNEAGTGMVAAGWWRGSRGTRLQAASDATQRRWDLALRRLSGAHTAAAQAVRVEDAQGTLVAFASIQVYPGAPGDADGAPAFAVFVRPLRIEAHDALAPELQSSFGLTRAECALALALRSGGDLGSAAALLGIGASSARTRLQAVFDKTGQHRQADLLCMLDALSDTLAHAAARTGGA